MRNVKSMLWALAGSASVTLAGGIDPTESAVLEVGGSTTINMFTDILTFIGFDDASASSSDITGSLSLAASDFNSPIDIQLTGLELAIDPAVTAQGSVIGGSFLGDADPVGVSLTGISLDSVIGGGFVEGIGESKAGIAIFDVTVSFTGTGFATYNLVSLDPQENQTIDLATIEPKNATLEIFTLQSMAGEITAEASLFLEVVNIPFEPGLVEIDISNNSSVFIQATGEDPNFNPDEFCSRADIVPPCGLLDLMDIVAFVQAFNNQQPIADLDGDGLFALADIVGFVTFFNAGGCTMPDEIPCYSAAAGASIDFHEGDAAYALGNHSMLTAGIAVSGAALMLGFGSFRRKTL